jgi:hypothetical protein
MTLWGFMLAIEGVRFNSYYVKAQCTPTRPAPLDALNYGMKSEYNYVLAEPQSF